MRAKESIVLHCEVDRHSLALLEEVARQRGVSLQEALNQAVEKFLKEGVQIPRDAGSTPAA